MKDYQSFPFFLQDSIINNELEEKYSDYNEIFSAKHPLTMGMEVEAFGFNESGLPLTSKEAKELLQGLPRAFITDYYPYQLELRTEAFDNPESVIQDFKSKWSQLKREAEKWGFTLERKSNCMDGDNELQFCGTHFHFRYKKHTQNFWKRGICAYPFIIALTDRFKNSNSNRQLHSPHFGVPLFHKNSFIRGARHYWDFSINNYKRTSDGHRWKDVPTLEIRSFDTISSTLSNEFLIKYLFNIYSRINEKKLSFLFNKNDLKNEYQFLFSSARQRLRERTMSVYSPSAIKNNFNRIFGKRNLEVVEDLNKFFGVDDNMNGTLHEETKKIISDCLKNKEFRDFNEMISFLKYDAHLFEEIYFKRFPIFPKSTVNLNDVEKIFGFDLSELSYEVVDEGDESLIVNFDSEGV